jgi:hypothetical protein
MISHEVWSSPWAIPAGRRVLSAEKLPRKPAWSLILALGGPRAPELAPAVGRAEAKSSGATNLTFRIAWSLLIAAAFARLPARHR